MPDISFEMNGQKVNPRNIGDAFEAAVLASIKDSVTKSVGSVRCAEHGERPSVKVVGRNLDNLNLEVKGCCDDLIERVKRKL